MLDTAAIEECILGTRTQWRVVDRQPYLAKKIAFLLTTKATICSILFSHQELCLKFVRTGGHYHYTIIRQPLRLLDSQGHTSSKRSKVWG